MVIDGDEHEAPRSREPAVARGNVLGVHVDAHGHGRPPDLRDLGHQLHQLPGPNRDLELDTIRGDRHHVQPRATCCRHPAGVIHQAQGVAAEHVAVVVGVVRHDELCQADLIGP